jgi:hypothetical protein
VGTTGRLCARGASYVVEGAMDAVDSEDYR